MFTFQTQTNMVQGHITMVDLQIKEGEIRMVRIDRTVFRKTWEERSFVQRIKYAHRKVTVQAGLNPRKDFNPNMQLFK
jgi:hypothetical protein